MAELSAKTVASPSQVPKHVASLLALIVAVNPGVAVIVTSAVAVQLLSSVTVTVYVPGVSPVALFVNCGTGEFQLY